jgi:hypothetical protein
VDTAKYRSGGSPEVVRMRKWCWEVATAKKDFPAAIDTTLSPAGSGRFQSLEP